MTNEDPAPARGLIGVPERNSQPVFQTIEPGARDNTELVGIDREVEAQTRVADEMAAKSLVLDPEKQGREPDEGPPVFLLDPLGAVIEVFLEALAVEVDAAGVVHVLEIRGQVLRRVGERGLELRVSGTE